MRIENLVDARIETLCLLFLEREDRQERLLCPECFDWFCEDMGYIHGDTAFCSVRCLRYAID